MRIVKKIGNRINDLGELKYYIILILCIIITSLGLYSQFIFGDKVLEYLDIGSDTFQGYSPGYEFYTSIIKDANFSEYSFRNGFGGDAIGIWSKILNPFVIPIIIVGLIFGSKSIAICIVYIQILKIICAGVLSYYFLRMFKFSNAACIISSYIYGFSGYMITMGEHYFFSEYPVYNIILLIFLEKIIRGNNRICIYIGLTLTVAIICVIGVYPAYVSILAAFFYGVYRLIYIYKKDFRKMIKITAVAFLLVILGILISTPLFLPQLLRISDSPRLVKNQSLSSKIVKSFTICGQQPLKSEFLRLFSNGLQGAPNSWKGADVYCGLFPCFYSVMLLPVASQYCWHTIKTKSSVFFKLFKMIPVLVVLFCIISNFVPSMFNSFVAPSYRYTFVLLPIFALAFSCVIDNSSKGIMCRWLNYVVMISICVVICINVNITQINKNASVIPYFICSVAFVIIGCFALDFLCLSNRKYNESDIISTSRVSVVFCGLIISLNMFFENFLTINYQRIIVDRDRINTPLQAGNIVEDVNKIENENFFRFETGYLEGRMPISNYSYLFDMRTTSYYNTSISENIIDFHNKLFTPDANYHLFKFQNKYQNFKNSDYIGIDEDILGVKYYISKKPLEEWGWAKVKDYDDGVALYQNPDINSAGLLFYNYIKEADANEADFSKRKEILPSHVILDTDNTNLLLSNDVSLPELEHISAAVFCYDDIHSNEGAIIDTLSIMVK